MKKLILFLLISNLISLSHANYLDDWTNEDFCRWMDADSIPEDISDEMFKRKVVCDNDSDLTKLSIQKIYTEENDTIFSSSKIKKSLKPKLQFRLNYKITL
jgi:hypothetical protein